MRLPHRREAATARRTRRPRPRRNRRVAQAANSVPNASDSSCSLESPFPPLPEQTCSDASGVTRTSPGPGRLPRSCGAPPEPPDPTVEAHVLKPEYRASSPTTNSTWLNAASTTAPAHASRLPGSVTTAKVLHFSRDVANVTRRDLLQRKEGRGLPEVCVARDSTWLALPRPHAGAQRLAPVGMV